MDNKLRVEIFDEINEWGHPIKVFGTIIAFVKDSYHTTAIIKVDNSPRLTEERLGSIEIIESDDLIKYD